MSAYLTKDTTAFGEAEVVTTNTEKTSGTNPPWVGVTFMETNTVGTFTLDGESAAGDYAAGATVYGEITAITGAADKTYVLYKAKIDH